MIGISTVFLGALLLSFVSRTITHPLDNLVSGVRALAAGDYMFSITPRGSSEVAELGEAFSKMRSELLASQRRWIAAERIAALGNAASSKIMRDRARSELLASQRRWIAAERIAALGNAASSLAH